MKNKFLVFCLALLGILSISSCAKDNETTTTSAKEDDNFPTNQVGENQIMFKATVLYPDGTPLEGATLQWCSIEPFNCYASNNVKTNSKGRTYYIADKNLVYYAHILKGLPDGYSYNPFELKQDLNKTDGEIHIFEVSSVTSGDDTPTSPYAISTGNYLIKRENNDVNDNKIRYYSFKPTTSGTYTIETYATTTSFVLEYFSSSFEGEAKTSTETNNIFGEVKNYKYTFTVSESDITNNSNFYFKISASKRGGISGEELFTISRQ